MSKFIKLLKEAISLKSDDKSEDIVNEMDSLNNRITNATLNGEDHWHLCWEKRPKYKCKEESDAN